MYVRTLHNALRRVNIDRFEGVAVSAGFDTHIGDLASLGLSERGYREIGRRIAALERPTFFVLEGGYDGEHVGKDIDALLTGFES
jgi:acetoin utilization deacetylase AcuC-like enzyme